MELSPLIAVVAIYLFILLAYLRLSPLLRSRQTRMVVYKELCNGCGNCVIVCPPNALRSLDVRGGKGPREGAVVMDIRDGIVLEFDINKCLRVAEPKKEPCRLCIDACPLNAIEFTY